VLGAGLHRLDHAAAYAHDEDARDGGQDRHEDLATRIRVVTVVATPIW
jgi:hypothetical protein